MTFHPHDTRHELDFKGADFEPKAISPYLEMGAYESLWAQPRTTFKSLSKKFAQTPDSVPSDFVDEHDARECAAEVVQCFEQAGVERFGVRVRGAGEYPSKLHDAENPLALLYYSGDWSLSQSPSVAVVGTREPSDAGIAHTKSLVCALVQDGFTIVSGLAAGIDSAAHETAIEKGGQTVAVLGTPLSLSYPKENDELQKRIAKYFLLISQVPVKRYALQDYQRNRMFFPERNITMSALTDATIIVEAGDRSGTLTQARAALDQGRKLFILDSCFENPNISWPGQFGELGAIRVRTYDDIKQRLPRPLHSD